MVKILLQFKNVTHDSCYMNTINQPVTSLKLVQFPAKPQVTFLCIMHPSSGYCNRLTIISQISLIDWTNYTLVIPCICVAPASFIQRVG
jgi:hypothetical protein